MVTDELLTYIRTQFSKNTPVDTVRTRLVSAGWDSADVDAALAQVQASLKSEAAKPV